MAQKNDILWKGILEVIFDDFLRFIFPEAEQVFNMQRTFEFLDKELAKMYPDPGKDTTTRLVDKLVKVFRMDGEEQWLLVHVEVQGHSDPLFAERMFQYYYRILDRYQRPVTAIAIFTGARGRSMPNYYEYDFLGTYHLYRYNTFCLLDCPDEILSTSDNPFALVVLAAKMALLKGKIPEIELKDRKLLIAKLLLQKGTFSRKKIDAILTFLNNYILFEKPETNRICYEENAVEMYG